MILRLLAAHVRMLTNRVRFASAADAGRAAALVGIGLLFLWGLEAGFERLLRYLQDEVPLIGGLLILKLLSMIFLTFLSMLVFSNLLTAFTTLYFARDLPLLLSGPVPRRVVVAMKSIESVFYASWTVLVAFAPFLLAYGRVKHVAWWFYPLAAAALAPFVAAAGAAGVGACLLLMRAFPSRRTRDLVLLFGVGIGGTVYLAIRFLQPEKLTRPDQLMNVLQYLSHLDAPTAMALPSYWLTACLNALTLRVWRDVAVFGGLLAGTAAALWIAVLALAARWFYPGWSAASAAADGRQVLSRAPWRGGSPARALAAKDVRLFLRDSTLWSQFLILVSLVLVYLFNISVLPLDTPTLKNLVSFLNIGMAGFVIAAVALRFMFPAVSLEGRAVWVLRAAPVPAAAILRQKFRLGLIPFLVLGGLLTLLSNWLLGVDPLIGWIASITMAAATAALVALGLGMGARFPRFQVDNIAQIESSAGGFLYMAAALGYVGLIMALEAWPVRMIFLQRAGVPGAIEPGWMACWFGAALAVTVAAGWWPMRSGARHLATMDL